VADFCLWNVFDRFYPSHRYQNRYHFQVSVINQ